jgi:hypothetical protein
LALGSAIGGALLAVAGAPAGASRPAPPEPGPSIVLARPIPGTVRVGALLRLAGHVVDVPSDTEAALEMRQSMSWTVVARAELRDRRAFKLRWRVPQTALGPLALRVVALGDRKLLAATPPQQSYAGPAPVYCNPAAPPVSLPTGDGWIAGGVYIEGGPFPGLYECESQPYTITATMSAGTVAASQSVAGGDGYALVVPAGSYTLTGACGSGTATVTAGQRTVANAYCLVPWRGEPTRERAGSAA